MTVKPEPCAQCGMKPSYKRQTGKSIIGTMWYRERVWCDCGMSVAEKSSPGQAVRIWNRKAKKCRTKATNEVKEAIMDWSYDLDAAPVEVPLDVSVFNPYNPQQTSIHMAIKIDQTRWSCIHSDWIYAWRSRCPAPPKGDE